MTFISVASLRRTFGLSVLQATTIIKQQRADALRRYRALEWTAQPCLLSAAIVVVFQLPLPMLVPSLLWLAGLTAIGLRLYLVHRISREPILATARAAAVATASRPTPVDPDLAEQRMSSASENQPVGRNLAASIVVGTGIDLHNPAPGIALGMANGITGGGRDSAPV